MNIKKLIILAPVAVLSLTSCGQSKRYKNEDYQLNLEWDTSRPFRILHLTDLHMSNVADKEKHFDFIRETVNMAKENDTKPIDLIAITGDMFTFAEKRDANELFAFFDSLKIPWAPTFGNHDEQVYFTVDWMTSRLNELNAKRENDGSSYCVFKDLQDDDVFGNANYVINLKAKSDKQLIEQLFFFDSNRYNFGEYRGYDYIHNDQIDWYERQVNTSMEVTVKIPSLAFFHIPFPEFEENYQKAKNGHTEEGVKYEFTKIEDTDGNIKIFTDHDDGTGDPKKNTGLYQKMLDLKRTNGVFIGHNHTSNYSVTRTGDDGGDITLCFGVKSTNRVYCDEEKLGGQVISISPPTSGNEPEGKFSIKRYFHKYGA